MSIASNSSLIINMFSIITQKSQMKRSLYNRFASDYLRLNSVYFNWLLAWFHQWSHIQFLGHSSIITFSIGMNFSIGWARIINQELPKLLRVLSKCSAANDAILCLLSTPPVPIGWWIMYSAFGEHRNVLLSAWSDNCSHRCCHPHNDGLNVDLMKFIVSSAQWQDQRQYLVYLT